VARRSLAARRRRKEERQEEQQQAALRHGFSCGMLQLSKSPFVLECK
jgi:hypothetical protein